MKRWLPLMTVLFVCAWTSHARAGELVCESQPAGYNFCRSATDNGVKLMEQLSQHTCFKDDTWGFDSGGVWVANGCSARFWLGPEKQDDAIKDQAQGNGASNLVRDLSANVTSSRKRAADATASVAAPKAEAFAAPQGTLKQKQVTMGEPVIVTCQSKQYRPQSCPTSVRVYVEIRKKIGNADCKFNKSWGYDLEQIWVKDGCRAEFSVY